jgi:hypothetical protein
MFPITAKTNSKSYFPRIQIVEGGVFPEKEAAGASRDAKQKFAPRMNANHIVNDEPD